MNKIRIVLAVLTIVMVFGSLNCQSQSKVSDFVILDGNKDGIINPYEALDVLLLIQKENKGELKLKNLKSALAAHEEESQNELKDIMKELDDNNNGIIEFDEVDDEEFMMFLQMMDKDKSKSVTKEEFVNFNFEDAYLLNDEGINEKIESIFKEYTKTDLIIINELNDTLQSKFIDWDLNRNGQITKKESFKYLKRNNAPVSFKIEGDVAYMSGLITSSTPATVLELVFQNPHVKTIEMIQCPGSIDDVANLRACLYVHQFGLNTRLNAKSMVASGGSDFFLAGKKREVAEGAKIGVHSWGGGTKAATDLSRSHDAHKKYLNYYEIVNIPLDFYWYTLDAAPANAIHWMTEEEIATYKVRTND